jgi:hypothetical protein
MLGLAVVAAGTLVLFATPRSAAAAGNTCQDTGWCEPACADPDSLDESCEDVYAYYDNCDYTSYGCGAGGRGGCLPGQVYNYCVGVLDK